MLNVYLFAVFCIGACVATDFEPCAEGNAPEKLRVQGCTSEPCLLYRGEDVIAEWDFTVVKDTEKIKPAVTVTVSGISMPYTLPEQDACKSLVNGNCPLDAGEMVTYRLRMPVRQVYPKIGLKLQFSIVDESENVHVCFNINARVVDR